MSKPKNIQYALAFDTSLQGLSCGVLDRQKNQFFAHVRPSAKGQSQDLVPYCQRLLELANIEFQDLDLIITTNGPGAFTGLRVGLSTARSFNIALDVFTIGVNTMQVIAHQYVCAQQESKNKKDIQVIIETKRKDFYTQRFDAKGNILSLPQSLNAQDLKTSLDKQQGNNICLIGDGAERFCNMHSGYHMHYMSGFDLIDPNAMIQMYVQGCVSISDAYESLKPLYLRDADVCVSKKTQRNLEKK